jgi:predicted GNAT superfamily acetyltransferase
VQIRIASPEDLEFIEGAYEHARTFMRANGNATQWPDGYPGWIDAEEDIARGHCFLVADNEGPLAVFTLAPGPDETYAKIDGAWHSEANYHVIHRVAAVREHGVARAIFSFAAEHADYLRCDTHEDNAPMRRALTSFGFKECGTITVANGTQRIAYDWLKEALHGSTPASPATR